MSSKFLSLALILGILAAIGGMVYFADQQGMINVIDPARAAGAKIPVVGQYIAPVVARLPDAELHELERLSAEKSRNERWADLKKKEEELRKAEGVLNQDRSRLSQWEGELERRELAINEREKEFTDREKQYEKSVKFYLTMRPAAAAKILSQQEDLLVIEIFRRMPERNVSAILAEMDPAVAGAIMRKMSR